MHTNEHLFVLLTNLTAAFQQYLLFVESNDRDHLIDALSETGLNPSEFETLLRAR